MTSSPLRSRLGLALAGLALAATACADVGSGSIGPDGGAPAATPTDEDAVVCQSIRTTIQQDKRAGDAARAAGDAAGARLKDGAVAAGVEGAKSVKGCDVSDLVPSPVPTSTPTSS